MRFKVVVFLLLANLIALSLASFTEKKCDIQIEILPDRFMFGELVDTKKALDKDKLEVNFMSDVMVIDLVHEGKVYKIEVVNENCQAYCKKAKRVRQLHSGDEKLVINLVKDRKDDIIQQLMMCQK